jgi:competence ComEA-like helix-hairpin-helix protein
MALVELQPSAQGRARRGTKKVVSLAPHGGGRVATPAARGIARRVAEMLARSVWAPVALRALGILAGMLALAAIGASSIARGSGIRATASSAQTRAPRLTAAGVTQLTEPEDAGLRDAPADAGSDSDAGLSEGLTPDGKVILNRAGTDELCRIPGVGPKRARAIVDLRTKLGGRFKRLSDLLRVKGIGLKSLKKMEPYVVLDAK